MTEKANSVLQNQQEVGKKDPNFYPFLLLTNDLIIRPLLEQDQQTFEKELRDNINEIHTWLPWMDEKPTIDSINELTQEYYQQAKNKTAYHYSVFKNNRFIGMCRFYQYNPEKKIVHLGYWSTFNRNNEDYFIDAINALLRYSFKEIGIREIEIPCVVGNFLAEKAAKLLNFKLQKIDIINFKQIKVFQIGNELDLPPVSLRWLADAESTPFEY